MSVLDVLDYHKDDQRFPSLPAPAVAAYLDRRKEATQSQVRRCRRVPHHPRGLQLPEHIQPARDIAFSGCTIASPPAAHSPSAASSPGRTHGRTPVSWRSSIVRPPTSPSTSAPWPSPGRGRTLALQRAASTRSACKHTLTDSADPSVVLFNK